MCHNRYITLRLLISATVSCPASVRNFAYPSLGDARYRSTN